MTQSHVQITQIKLSSSFIIALFFCSLQVACEFEVQILFFSRDLDFCIARGHNDYEAIAGIELSL